MDAWETSYLHILPGPDAVLEWTKGTTLRPVLAALDSEQAAAFVGEYAERLRQVYRPRSFGTMFPFRRVFTVVTARRPDASWLTVSCVSDYSG